MKSQNKSKEHNGFKSLVMVSLLFLSQVPVTAQGSGIPSGWDFSGVPASYKAGIDYSISRNGQKSATIESVTENPADFCTLMQSAVYKEFKNRRVKMTGYIKSEGEGVTTTMWARIDDIGNKKFGDFDNMTDRPLSGTNDWTKCEIVFDVPESCIIFYGFIFEGKGKIWCDNVAFEIVPATVAKTAKPMNTPFTEEYLVQLKQYPDIIPEKPPFNLDFEIAGAPSMMISTSSEAPTSLLPKIDLHVHLTGAYGSTTALRYAKASALSEKMGVVFGIAEEIATPDVKRNDAYLNECITLARNYNLYIGLQVLEPGWTKFYSKKVLDSVDYIMEDALRFPDKDGKVRLLWVEGVNFPDPQDFMDRYVAYNIKVLSDPVNIWGNPTFLPISLQARYDELWTEPRMKAVIDAAVKNNVAIEINSRFKIPGKKFIQMARAAGAHFTFGSNEHDTNIGNISWAIDMAKECGLDATDFFTPTRKLR